MFLKEEGITREQVMNHLNSMDRNKTSIEADLKDVGEWNVAPGHFDITLDGKSYHFGKWAQSQLLRKLRIPISYFETCSEELRNKELKEGFEKLGYGTENRFKIWVNPETQEQHVYGFIPLKCRDMLSGEITEQVLNGLGSQDGVQIMEFDSSLEVLRVRFVNTKNSYVEVDEVFPAVDFVFSEVIKTPIKIQSVLHRKVCSNGLVVPQEINQSFKMPLPHFKPDIFDLQIQYVDNSVSGLDSIAKTLEALKSIELPQALISPEKDEKNLFDEIFEYVLPSKRIRSDYDRLIRVEYNSEGNYTANGVVNATTKIARDIESEMKVTLEASAGMFVSKIAVQDEQAKIAGGTFAYNKDNIAKIFRKRGKLGTARTHR